jgi:hypothetical protein
VQNNKTETVFSPYKREVLQAYFLMNEEESVFDIWGNFGICHIGDSKKYFCH